MNYTALEQTALSKAALQAGLNKDTLAIFGRHLQVRNMVCGTLMSTSNPAAFSWVSTIFCHFLSTSNEEGPQYFIWLCF